MRMDSIKDQKYSIVLAPQSNNNIDDPDNRIVQYIQNAHVKVGRYKFKISFPLEE